MGSELLAIAALLTCSTVSAQNIDPGPSYEEVSKMAVPVVAGDITDHPYKVIADVSRYVGASVISHPSDDKMRRKLWEKAKKLGADAVIHARLGSPNHAFPEMGSRTASGKAIRFVTKDR